MRKKVPGTFEEDMKFLKYLVDQVLIVLVNLPYKRLECQATPFIYFYTTFTFFSCKYC